MITAFVNGVIQSPNSDYVVGPNVITFSQAPGYGATIDIYQNNNTRVASIFGDGASNVFHMDMDPESYHRLTNMLNDALECRNNPAVAEALERLHVVVALAKENG